ncbi:MAG: hypothetical protein WC378_21030, partial [Opitutaceae bacterium]
MRRSTPIFIYAAFAAAAFAAPTAEQPKDNKSAPPAVSQDSAPANEKTKPGMMSKAASAFYRTSSDMTQRVSDGALKMRDLFDIVLPGALGKNHLELDFEPKFGDFTKREFVRYPFELRYGLSDKWEAYGGLTPVSPNPFKSGPDHRWGPGMAKLGVRRDLVMGDFYFPKIAIGLEGTAPVGEPPVDLIDHYVHVKPYLTATRQLKTLPDTTLLLALSYDQAISCPNRANVPLGVIKRNVTEIAPGLLYKPNEYGAFAMYSLVFFDEPTGQRVRHEGKMGFLWDMPLEKSRKWSLPGKWQFELGYKISDED